MNFGNYGVFICKNPIISHFANEIGNYGVFANENGKLWGFFRWWFIKCCKIWGNGAGFLGFYLEKFFEFLGFWVNFAIFGVFHGKNVILGPFSGNARGF